MTDKPEITKDSIIADVLREYPECIKVFDSHNMPCRTCMAADTGSISEGAMMHDLDADRIVSELRDCCRKHDQPEA